MLDIYEEEPEKLWGITAEYSGISKVVGVKKVTEKEECVQVENLNAFFFFGKR